MRYIMITLIALTAFGAYGCAPSQNRITPPDHVLDPRGS
jgi:hypothetical protein